MCRDFLYENPPQIIVFFSATEATVGLGDTQPGGQKGEGEEI